MMESDADNQFTLWLKKRHLEWKAQIEEIKRQIDENIERDEQNDIR